MSGSEIVDLKHFENKKAKVACGLKADYLTGFLCQLIFQRRKTKKTTGKDLMMSLEMRSLSARSTNKPAPKDSTVLLSTQFQETIQIQLFGLNVS